MKLLLVAASSVLVVLIALSLVQPSNGLFLGQGGVYNSPEAQAYWNRRYVQKQGLL